jgi:hypothetical protein
LLYINALEMKKQVMQAHSDIYIRLKEFADNNKHPDNKKRVIFKGKYCQTYLFEDDEVYLRNKIYSQFNNFAAYNKNSPKKKKSEVIGGLRKNYSDMNLSIGGVFGFNKADENININTNLNSNNANTSSHLICSNSSNNITSNLLLARKIPLLNLPNSKCKNQSLNNSQSTITTKASKNFKNGMTLSPLFIYRDNIEDKMMEKIDLRGKSVDNNISSIFNVKYSNNDDKIDNLDKKYGIAKKLKFNIKSKNILIKKKNELGSKSYLNNFDFYYQ